MLHIRRRTGAVAALAIVVAVASVTAGAIAASGGSARKTSGTAYLGPTARTAPGLVYYAGFNSDKVLGQGAVTYTIKPTSASSGTITATAKKVTLWTSNGKLTRGTGGQTGHSLVGTFTGTGNIVSGQYVFHYKATYK
jgi:hypothetical protein